MSYALISGASRAQEKEIEELKSKIAQVLAVMPNDTFGGPASTTNHSRVRLAESPPGSTLDPNATAYTPKGSLVASTEAWKRPLAFIWQTHTHPPVLIRWWSELSLTRDVDLVSRCFHLCCCFRSLLFFSVLPNAWFFQISSWELICSKRFCAVCFLYCWPLGSIWI